MSLPNLTGPLRATCWRALSFACRHRASPGETTADVGTPGECRHPDRDGEPCTSANAALGKCPVIELVGSATVTSGIQQLFDAAAAGFNTLWSKIRRKPLAGRTLPNYYELLGVPIDATEAEIRAAFREKAKIHHPDRRGGDSRKMAELNDAQSVLTDPAARAEYDKFKGFRK